MSQPQTREQPPLPPSINDTVESSSPSLKTVLIVFGCAAVAIGCFFIYGALFL